MNMPVVVGVDGSESAVAAVRWAADEARRRGGRVRLLHAVDVPTGYPQGFVDPDVLRAGLAAQGRTWLEEAERAVGGTVPVEVVEAAAVPALVRESAHAALVVLGTRGLLLGSTSQRLPHHAPCSVAVVPTTPEG